MDNNNNNFYANSVNVMTSVYEVALHFRAETPVVVGEGKRTIKETFDSCSVRMSPQHAKALAALLLKHITDYEKKYNLDLPLPPDVQEFWDECTKRKDKEK